MGSYFGFQTPKERRLIQQHILMGLLNKDFDLRLKQLDAIQSQIQDQSDLEKHRFKKQAQILSHKNKIYDIQVQIERLAQKANNQGLTSIIPKFKRTPVYQQLMQQLGKIDPTKRSQYITAVEKRYGYAGTGNTAMTSILAPIQAGKRAYDTAQNALDFINKANVKVKQIADSQILPAIAIGSALAGTGYLLYKGSRKAAQKIPQPIKNAGRVAGRYLIDQYGGKVSKYVKDNYGNRIKNYVNDGKQDAIQNIKNMWDLSTPQMRQMRNKKLANAQLITQNGSIIKLSDVLPKLSSRAGRNLKQQVEFIVKNRQGDIHVQQIVQSLGYNQRKQVLQKIEELEKNKNLIQSDRKNSDDDENFRINRIVLHQ